MLRVANPTDYHLNGVTLSPTHLLVIQPTPFCNIDCKYCYLPNRSNTKRMSMDTVRAIVRFAEDIPFFYEPFSVLWHAGEPLSMPISFYDQAFKYFVEGSKLSVQQCMQTNGTLINDSWCKFFKNWKVNVSVSIDGPEVIHNSYRVDRNGSGTFDKVIQGIKRLKEHKIPFSIITVLTRDALLAPEKIWSFYKDLEITSLAFNVEEVEGNHTKTSLRGNTALEEFKEFMQCIFELNRKDRTVHVREFEYALAHLMAPPYSQVNKSDNRAGAIISIDVDGNVSTFSPELLGTYAQYYGQFYWGNVRFDSFREIVSRPSFLKVYNEISEGVKMCKDSCPYFSMCGGGSPCNKLAELGTFASTETQYCRLHIQAISDIVLEAMEKELLNNNSTSHLEERI